MTDGRNYFWSDVFWRSTKGLKIETDVKQYLLPMFLNQLKAVLQIQGRQGKRIRSNQEAGFQA